MELAMVTYRSVLMHDAVDWKIKAFGQHVPFPSTYPFVS
jgi:hypothetical protein